MTQKTIKYDRGVRRRPLATATVSYIRHVQATQRIEDMQAERERLEQQLIDEAARDAAQRVQSEFRGVSF